MSRRPAQELRAATTCALCRLTPSTPAGEHVLPLQATRALFSPGNGPFTTLFPGGDLTRQQFDSIKLPCCADCNSELNRRFENHGAGPAIRLMSTEDPGLTTEESYAAALWILKTWVLLGHPESEYRAATPRPNTWGDAPAEIYSWLIHGSLPPPSLSVWACALSQDPSAPQGAPARMWLPTVIKGAKSSRFRVVELAVARLNVAVVYHPGWSIDLHPETAGGPRRIWPWTGLPLDRLPQYESRPVRWSRGPDLWFLPGAFEKGGLPPLVPDVQPDELVRPLLMRMSAPPIGGE